MRPVNLIPSDRRRGDSAPLRTGVTSYAVVGALALVLAGIVAVVLTNNQIADSKSERSDLEARQQVAQQQAAVLAPYGEFASLSEDRRATVTSLARSRFDWERVLNELARVIPSDVWLSHVTGTVSPSVTFSGTQHQHHGEQRLVDLGRGERAVARDHGLRSRAGGRGQVRGVAQGHRWRHPSRVAEVGARGQVADCGGSDQRQRGHERLASAGSCQTKQFIAAFEITVAFDAVPVAQYAPSSSSTAPAASTSTATTATTTSTTGTTTTSTTDDGGVAATQTEQQSATDSAAQQSSQAQQGASAVGMGG